MISHFLNRHFCVFLPPKFFRPYSPQVGIAYVLYTNLLFFFTEEKNPRGIMQRCDEISKMASRNALRKPLSPYSPQEPPKYSGLRFFSSTI